MALAYNLGNFLWRLALAKAVKCRTLTTLREELGCIGAKVVTHGRRNVRLRPRRGRMALHGSAAEPGQIK